MRISECSILLLHLRSKEPQKKQEMKLTPETTFEEVKNTVKDLYKIDENPFDLFAQQIGRQVLLDNDNFQHFKQNAHILKIIKVVEYDVRDSTVIKFSKEKKSEEKVQERDLGPIEKEQLENNFSSFLADDFEKVVPALELVCEIKPTIVYSEEEKEAQRILEQMLSRIKERS